MDRCGWRIFAIEWGFLAVFVDDGAVRDTYSNVVWDSECCLGFLDEGGAVDLFARVHEPANAARFGCLTWLWLFRH